MTLSAPHVALVSLGCPKNLVDSERLMALLAEAGCVVGAEMTDAEAANLVAFLKALSRREPTR